MLDEIPFNRAFAAPMQLRSLVVDVTGVATYPGGTRMSIDIHFVTVGLPSPTTKGSSARIVQLPEDVQRRINSAKSDKC
jgi:hypothetical protein